MKTNDTQRNFQDGTNILVSIHSHRLFIKKSDQAAKEQSQLVSWSAELSVCPVTRLNCYLSLFTGCCCCYGQASTYFSFFFLFFFFLFSVVFTSKIFLFFLTELLFLRASPKSSSLSWSSSPSFSRRCLATASADVENFPSPVCSCFEEDKQ